MFRHYKAQTPVALQIKKMGNQKSMTPCFNLYGRIFNVFTKSDSLKAFSVLFAKKSEQTVHSD